MTELNHDQLREKYRRFLIYLFPNLKDDEEQLEDAVGQFEVFLDAMAKFEERNAKYRSLWRKGGWLSHLVHVKSKLDRAIHIFMTTDTWQHIDDPLDDSYDQLNFKAFFIRKFKEGDRSGGMAL